MSTNNIVHVKPSQALQGLKIGMELREPILLVGAPGVGKSDLGYQAAREMNFDMILSHPVVSDPTDAKGLPWPDAKAGVAKFLPFGDLHKALNATRPTVWFLDDLGQATNAVQAAFMQLLLAREIAGHKLPDCVTFIAATNRRADRAGVGGILEPVKSRFLSILHLEADLDEWFEWAYTHNIHPLVIAFLRLRTELLHKFAPSAEIVNYPCPRTWGKASKMMNSHLLTPEMALPMFAGCLGVEAATEFVAFVKICEDIPMPEAVLTAPMQTHLPENISVQYALSTALADIVSEATFPSLVTYANRMRDELQATEMAVTMLKDACKRHPELKQTTTYVELITSPLGQQMA